MAEEIYSSNNFGLGGRVVARREELRDSRVYQRLKDEAARRGVEIEILSDEEFAEALGQPAPEAPKPDDNGIVTDAKGNRFLAIPESRARIFSQYCAAREQAKELGVGLTIVPDGNDAA
jgi:hypothetical protein